MQGGCSSGWCPGNQCGSLVTPKRKAETGHVSGTLKAKQKGRYSYKSTKQKKNTDLSRQKPRAGPASPSLKREQANLLDPR